MEERRCEGGLGGGGGEEVECFLVHCLGATWLMVRETSFLWWGLYRRWCGWQRIRLRTLPLQDCVRVLSEINPRRLVS
jgi:hypothetical protein